MEGVWKVSKGCLEVPCRVSGECLEGVWKVYQVRIGKFWACQVRTGLVKSGQVGTGQVWTGQVRKVKSEQVKSGQVKSG